MANDILAAFKKYSVAAVLSRRGFLLAKSLENAIGHSAQTHITSEQVEFIHFQLALQKFKIVLGGISRVFGIEYRVGIASAVSRHYHRPEQRKVAARVLFVKFFAEIFFEQNYIVVRKHEIFGIVLLADYFNTLVVAAAKTEVFIVKINLNVFASFQFFRKFLARTVGRGVIENEYEIVVGVEIFFKRLNALHSVVYVVIVQYHDRQFNFFHCKTSKNISPSKKVSLSIRP